MRTKIFITLLFTVYCIEVGTFFVLWPWRGGWDHLWLQVSWPTVRHFLLHPMGRSLFSAFGIVHLVWAAHELDQMVQRWLDRDRPLPAPRTEDK